MEEKREEGGTSEQPQCARSKRVKLESNREEPSSMPIITIVSGKQ